jgi:tRNA A37 methylthiotransferase MiaB
LWPEFIDKKCLEVFKNTRVYPHFHYSVQSWSTDVLKNMRRHYNWKYIRDLLENTKNIKRDDNVNISIWADIIIWFPWETKKNFEETYNLVKDWLITKVHSFPFSAHTMWESVPAWKFKNQIDEKIKKDRLEKINKISEKVREEFIKSQVWKEFKVLIESVKWKSWKWWSENYIECNEKNFQIKSGNLERNEIIIWNLIN